MRRLQSDQLIGRQDTNIGTDQHLNITRFHGGELFGAQAGDVACTQRNNLFSGQCLDLGGCEADYLIGTQGTDVVRVQHFNLARQQRLQLGRGRAIGLRRRQGRDLAGEQRRNLRGSQRLHVVAGQHRDMQSHQLVAEQGPDVDRGEAKGLVRADGKYLVCCERLHLGGRKRL